jgi:predicted nucleotidyltransferase
MRPDFARYGFRYEDRLIMAFIGGSQMHGAKIPESEDTDWYGVYVEPPEKILGIDRDEHFVFTTGGGPGGNGPQDTDVCLYSLQKFAHLACKGNPSVLHFLFATEQFATLEWGRLCLNRNLFLAKGHLNQFLGFANAQYLRLMGGAGQMNVHRQALEQQFGFDTKYAMHVIRLYGEAIEFAETGVITLPRPNAEELIAIRRGKYTLREIEEMGRDLESKLLQARETTQLPNRIDRDKVSELLVGIYRMAWERSHDRV